jgi:hypothetical protein
MSKLTLTEFAEMMADHSTKEIIEMLYNRMSADDLMEMADEHNAEKCVECCEVVKDDHGWTDSMGKQYCDDCKEMADNYDPLEEEEEEECECGECSRCLADDTCAGDCGDQGTITVTGKNGTKWLVCKDCCSWFKKKQEVLDVK